MLIAALFQLSSMTKKLHQSQWHTNTIFHAHRFCGQELKGAPRSSSCLYQHGQCLTQAVLEWCAHSLLASQLEWLKSRLGRYFQPECLR